MEQHKKKILILGGETKDIVEVAQQMGLHVIVTSNHDKGSGKMIADESLMISTTDFELLEKYIKQNNVSGVFAGPSEFHLYNVMQLCKRIDFPFYATEEQWDLFSDKEMFKRLCQQFGLPVAKDYSFEQKAEVVYPVIVKPVDGCSGRGITICDSERDIEKAYLNAINESNKKRVVIEKYLFGQEVVLFYVIKDGNIKLSAMSDYYYNYEQGRTMPLPQAYIFPSKHLDIYFSDYHYQVVEMLTSVGIKNGTFFLQAFVNEKGFWFFEPGFRQGGSLVYKYTKHINDISYLEMLVNHATQGNIPYNLEKENPYFSKFCCTLSIVGKGGTIKSIIGYEDVVNFRDVIGAEKRYDTGDTVKSHSALAQIILRFFIVSDSKANLIETIEAIQKKIQIVDTEDNDMLFTKFSIDNLISYK